MKRIYVDFGNMDAEGHIRLNTIGTISDLSAMSISLEDGARLVVTDDDLVAEIRVRQPGVEGIWRGELALGPFDVHEEEGIALLRASER